VIFSKDKKPTEIGWYWALDASDRIPHPREVEWSREYGLYTAWFAACPIEEYPGRWGDRIQPPSVDPAQVAGGGEA
jgi:hypothetical protein